MDGRRVARDCARVVFLVNERPRSKTRTRGRNNTVVAAANHQDGADQVSSLLELTKDMIVQEDGWDADCDASISEGDEDAVGPELLEEDTDEGVGAVMLRGGAAGGAVCTN